MSTTVQSTWVAPMLNTAGASLLTLATPQLSETTGVPSATLVETQLPASALAITLAGQRICGGSLSTTVTVCWQLLLLPFTSVAIQVTTVVPTGKSAGALLTTLAMPQLSAATGEPKFTLLATHWPASPLTVTLAGQVSDGGVVS